MADAQLPGHENVKAQLLQTDESFRQLVTEHQTLDDRIQFLESYSHLTDQQRFEQVSLKKKKLALKDRIEELLRRRPGAAER